MVSPLVFTLVATHVTIAGVTLFLHRSQAHKSVTLHPIIAHIFRFWLWLTTGMETKQWVAIHRKHHAKCETAEDPHSPVYLGVWNVMFLGVLFYKKECKNQVTMEQYGQETPEDWLEKNVYARHSAKGILLMLLIDLYLFGATGLVVWLIQMAWIPFWAAGFINGVGHWFGYRNFAAKDTSTNISPLILPIGLIVGGEEFHNNHHAFPRSARLSYQKWEFDIGWFYLKTLEKFGLCKIHEFLPYPEKRSSNFKFGTNLQLFANKMVSLRKYELNVLKKALSERFDEVSAKVKVSYKSALRALSTHTSAMNKEENARLSKICDSSSHIAKLYKFKENLEEVWQGVGLSVAERAEKVKAWCKEVEETGNEDLIKFSNYIKAKMGIGQKAKA